MCLLLIGILRQLGLVQRQLVPDTAQPQGGSSIPTLEQDGPVIGSPLADLESGTINGFGTLTLTTLRNRGSTLLVFMSPMCETCQHIVEPLNTLAPHAVRAVNPVLIIRADEQGRRAF